MEDITAFTTSYQETYTIVEDDGQSNGVETA